MHTQSSGFYITTPIYYVNDIPHIGHAYTTILADVLARYQRLWGTSTFFLTGTDEHGQKVAQAAEKKGISPLDHCHQTVVRFQELWTKLGITHDDFIRTTEERHQNVVQHILQQLYDRGEIYQAEYEGWYCVPCERFYTEKDLSEDNCPECKRTVDRIVEPNYFFRMSKHQDWLIDYINSHDHFILPEFRRNEALGFLRNPLGDLCISRPKSRLPWGIQMPFDANFVCYVWFDALINYISAPGYHLDPEKFARWWPASCHLIGKDILTTHSVYWPIMLKAMELPMPKTIFAHGWWLIGRDKMGKSLGNVVNPMMVCDRYGSDAFRYFLISRMSPGQDAAFAVSDFIHTYNLDLADNLGNMLNRVVKLLQRHCDSRIPESGTLTEPDHQLKDATLHAIEEMAELIAEFKLDRALHLMMQIVHHCNQYFEHSAPWELAKKQDHERLATVLVTAAECLRVVSGLLHPIMPEKMTRLRQILGITSSPISGSWESLQVWPGLIVGSEVKPVDALFPRIETHPDDRVKLPLDEVSDGGQSETATAMETPSPEVILPESNETETNLMTTNDLIDFDDFKKVQLRTAMVVVAEKVKGADRLLRLEIQLGSESRQIVAGIAQYYQAEELIGKTIVIVANLKPATIRGLISHGMLLVAKADGALKLLTVAGNIATGAEIG